MLFSCLVDADYLDTEAFYDRVEGRLHAAGASACPRRTEAQARRGSRPTSPPRLTTRGKPRACRDPRRLPYAAAERPGLFTLTVPTGGGKTLASLAFALEHALAHKALDRVIYVIPYTSIIEQNAAVFREALGAEAVLEHHSASIDDPKAAPEARRQAAPRDGELARAGHRHHGRAVVRVAVRRPDVALPQAAQHREKRGDPGRGADAAAAAAPAVRRGARRTRAQLRTSVVLCTATQPALIETTMRRRVQGWLRDVREIAPEPKRLYQTFKRVTVEQLGEIDDEALAAHLREHEQALCIVNTRTHARELYERLAGAEGCYHLSALMCPKHRSQRLEEIRERLDPRRRGAASWSAHRWSRPGSMWISRWSTAPRPGSTRSPRPRAAATARGGSSRGDVFVFRPAGRRVAGRAEPSRHGRGRRVPASRRPARARRHRGLLPRGLLERAAPKTGSTRSRSLIASRSGRGDFLFPFEAIARDFRLIEDGMLPILIPFDDEARGLLKELGTHRAGRRDRAPSPALCRPGAARAVRAPLRCWRGAAGRPAALRRAVLGARQRRPLSPGCRPGVGRSDLSRGGRERDLMSDRKRIVACHGRHSVRATKRDDCSRSSALDRATVAPIVCSPSRAWRRKRVVD